MVAMHDDAKWQQKKKQWRKENDNNDGMFILYQTGAGERENNGCMLSNSF